ncbi:MAG: hypothetical protein V1767_09630 [Chloroflexota bacterium]
MAQRGYSEQGVSLPKETYIKQVESLAVGQGLVYQTPKMFWDTLGAFIIIELNPQYPGKHQKKYNVFADEIAGDKPAGKKRTIVGLDKPQHVADFLRDKSAKPIS